MAAKKMSASAASHDAAIQHLREMGLAYPGAHLKSPWPGHLDLAVKDKTFAYLSAPGDPFKVSCKLPESAADALAFPFATPTEYGLGKSGWVTARFEAKASIPVALFEAWIEESYRAQAPRTLVKQFDAGVRQPLPVSAKPKPKPKPKTAAPKKAAAKPTKKRASR